MNSKLFTIKHDDSPDIHPRTDCENLGTMACWHKRYTLGDIQPKEDSNDWVFKNVPKGSIVLPVYMYDHSGLTINTTGFSQVDSARWDWGQLGIIFCTPDRIKKEYSIKRITKATREKVRKVLIQEIETYDKHLRGAVWGYVYEGPEGYDSCWGFIGDTLEETGIREACPAYITDSLIEHAWENRA